MQQKSAFWNTFLYSLLRLLLFPFYIFVKVVHNKTCHIFLPLCRTSVEDGVCKCWLCESEKKQSVGAQPKLRWRSWQCTYSCAFLFTTCEKCFRYYINSVHAHFSCNSISVDSVLSMQPMCFYLKLPWIGWGKRPHFKYFVVENILMI